MKRFALIVAFFLGIAVVYLVAMPNVTSPTAQTSTAGDDGRVLLACCEKGDDDKVTVQCEMKKIEECGGDVYPTEDGCKKVCKDGPAMCGQMVHAIEERQDAVDNGGFTKVGETVIGEKTIYTYQLLGNPCEGENEICSGVPATKIPIETRNKLLNGEIDNNYVAYDMNCDEPKYCCEQRMFAPMVVRAIDENDPFDCGGNAEPGIAYKKVATAEECIPAPVHCLQGNTCRDGISRFESTNDDDLPATATNPCEGIGDGFMYTGYTTPNGRNAIVANEDGVAQDQLRDYGLQACQTVAAARYSCVYDATLNPVCIKGPLRGNFSDASANDGLALPLGAHGTPRISLIQTAGGGAPINEGAEMQVEAALLAQANEVEADPNVAWEAVLFPDYLPKTEEPELGRKFLDTDYFCENEFAAVCKELCANPQAAQQCQEICVAKGYQVATETCNAACQQQCKTDREIYVESFDTQAQCTQYCHLGGLQGGLPPLEQPPIGPGGPGNVPVNPGPGPSDGGVPPGGLPPGAPGAGGSGLPGGGLPGGGTPPPGGLEPVIPLPPTPPDPPTGGTPGSPGDPGDPGDPTDPTNPTPPGTPGSPGDPGDPTPGSSGSNASRSSRSSSSSEPDAELEIEKGVLGSDTVESGDNVVFQITVRNTSDIDAEDVVVEDFVPPGFNVQRMPSFCSTQTSKIVFMPEPGQDNLVVLCDIGDLPAGQSERFNITFSVGEGGSTGGQSNSSRSTNPLLRGQLVGGATPSECGDSIENEAIAYADNADEVEDNADVEVICASSSSSESESASSDGESSSEDESSESSGESSSEDGEESSDGESSDASSRSSRTTSSRTPSSRSSSERPARISVDKELLGNTRPDAGTDITFRITVRNSSQVDAQNVVLQDFLPFGLTSVTYPDTCTVATQNREQILTCRISTLPAGRSERFLFTFSLDANACDPLENLAVVFADNANEEEDSATVRPTCSSSRSSRSTSSRSTTSRSTSSRLSQFSTFSNFSTPNIVCDGNACTDDDDGDGVGDGVDICGASQRCRTTNNFPCFECRQTSSGSSDDFEFSTFSLPPIPPTPPLPVPPQPVPPSPIPPSEISPPEIFCGNNRRDPDEECDDGNRFDGDGCSGNCFLEVGSCGDGIVQELLGEQCEPGVTTILPCNQNCRYVLLFCGNGEVNAGEDCDEGPANSQLPGASCRQDCSNARCGDGILDPDEVCDDGNYLSGDGCSAFCQREQTAGGKPTPDIPGSITDIPFVGQLQGTPGIPGQPGVPGQPGQPGTYTPPQTTETGPGVVIAVMGAGAAAGYAFVRRRRRK